MILLWIESKIRLQKKWTYEELDDLIYAFIKTANDNVEGKCVRGCIEMVKNSYSVDGDE